MRILPTNIDELQIEINAQATKANDAIDRLVLKLDRLTTSLGRINTTNLNGLANGVQRLGNAMQIMNGVKTADFTRLATNLQRLGAINVSSLNSAASSMSHLTRAFNNLGTVSNNAQQVGVMAGNLARLGGANVQRAVTTIPQLATAINNLMTTLSRAPQVSQNVIQLTNSLANLASQGSRVGTATDSINRNLNSTNRTVRSSRSSWGGFASVIGRFYASCFLAIRGINALGESIQDTADYFEAYNYFNVALGKIGSDWEDDFSKYGYDSAEAYADSFATRLQDKLSTLSGLQISSDGMLETTGMKNLGLNIQEITQFSAQLASVTNSVGQVGEVSLATSSAFTKLAGDMSSLFNMDYSQVATNLSSALIGQSRSVYKYGIDITNATLQTYAYSLGVEKAVSEMTQAEKMQLRLIAILDQSRVSWGDASNTINSIANQMRILENNMQEISLVLGQLFVPLMEKALPVVNGLTIAIKNLLVNLAGILGIEIDPNKFGQGFTEIEDELDNQENQIEDNNKALEKYKEQLLGFDEVNKLQDQDATATLNTNTDEIDLTKEILAATEEYEKFWKQAYDEMDNLSDEWAKYFEQFTKPFEKIFVDIKLGDFFALGQDISKPINDLQLWVQDIVAGVDWDYIGQSFGQFFTSTSMSASNIFGESSTTISDIIEGINKFMTSATESIEWGEILGSIIDGLTDFIKGIDVDGIVSTLYDTLAVINEAIVDIFDWILDNPDEIAELFGAFIQKVLELVVVLVAANIELIAKGLADIFSTLMENALDKYEQTKEGVTKFSNTLKDIFQDGAEAWKNGNFASWLAETIKSVMRKALERIKTGFGSVEEFFSPIVDGVKDVFADLPSWFSEKFGKLGEDTSSAFNEIGTNAKTALETKWNELKEWFSGTAVAQWWQEITDLFPASEWQGLFSDISSGLQTKWNEAINWFENTAVGQFFEKVRTNLTMEKFRDSMGSITTAVSRRWSGMINWIKSTGVTNLWSNIKTYLSEAEWVKGLVGLTDGFKTAFNNAISAVKQLWNNFADFLNGKLTWTIDPVVVMGRTLFKGTTIDLGKVPKFWTGGFPEDGLFMANHNELVGKFSNGRTAVANNYQIEAGIEQASYRGMARALAEYSGNGGNVTVVLQGDADGLFRVVQNKANNYTQQTGQPAFII